MAKNSTIVRIVLGAYSVASHLVPGRVGRKAGYQFFVPKRAKAQLPGGRGLEGRPFDVRVAGDRVRGWAFGDGPTVLLSHGWESQASHFDAWIGALVAAGFQVVTWDQPGHGHSEGGRTTGYVMARAVEAVARAVGPVYALVGHSLGATAALAAVTGAPDGRPLPVERLVLVSPLSRAEYAVAFVEEQLGLSKAASVAFRDEIEKFFGRGISDTDALRWSEGMPSLPPALVFHDRKDREVPYASAEHVVAAWRGRASLVEVEGLGHRRILRDADVITRAVEFLAEGAREDWAPTVHAGAEASATT